jgi:hypothetical protein
VHLHDTVSLQDGKRLLMHCVYSHAIMSAVVHSLRAARVL